MTHASNSFSVAPDYGSGATALAGDINIVAIVKGEERYVFMFDDDSRAETLRTLGRYASNPELSFSWYDAAVLSQKVRKTQVGPSLPNAGNTTIVNRIAAINEFHQQSNVDDDEVVDPIDLDPEVDSLPTDADFFNDSMDSYDAFPSIDDFPPVDDLWIGDEPTS